MIASLLLSLALAHVCASLSTPGTQLLRLGSQGINLLKLQQHRKLTTFGQDSSSTQSTFQVSQSLERKYPELYFDQPLDHFDEAVNHTFGQRYWVDDRFYEPGGPVFVLDGGETSGADRLPYMDHGILEM